jgi:peptidoglycan/xylan/chitin deacetylase (PgdA/CDA1 family)
MTETASGMKPVMYHYVRPKAEGLPHFPYLSLADFERQLDDFAADHGFVSRDAFISWAEGGSVPSGVLLTFDDGLRDHIDFVLPALTARGLFGLFYVSSGPAVTGRILDVHKVHLALGRLGGPNVLAWLEANAPKILPPAEERSESSPHYAGQVSDAATKFVKRLFNWELSGEERGPVLDALLDHAFAGSPPRWQEIYLDGEVLRDLSSAGMGVGPHSHTHEVSAELSPQRQREEVELSCEFVELNGGSRAWGYCYPHGLAASFSPETERAVAAAGCPMAFAVEARDITAPLGRERRFALPRHNCNAFPHGTASYGGGE